jgi:hypothetical protein
VIKKLLVATAVAGAAFGAGTASAAEPNCLGTTASTNAHTFHPFGQVILVPSTPRGEDGGTIGDAVAAIRAGQVPDSIYPNACND